MKFRSLIIVILLSQFLFAQEKQNQLDQNQKKHGLWKIYLDQQFKEVVKDEAHFFYLWEFDHGGSLMKPPNLNKRALVSEGEGHTDSTTGKIALDGKYIFTKRYKPKWRFELVFENGHLLSERIDWDTTQSANYIFRDYTNKLEGFPASCYHIQRQGDVQWYGYLYVKDGKRKKDSIKVQRYK